MKYGILWLLSVLFVSCSSIQINHQKQKTTTAVVELGAIGIISSNLLSVGFKTNALPIYKQKIRLQAVVVPFDKYTYKAYKKAAGQQNSPKIIAATDTVTKMANKYVRLQIIDKVQLINELNAEYNKNVKSYIQTAEANTLVLNTSVYLDKNELSSVMGAEEIYLINNKPKKYSLELVKNGKIVAVINLSKAVPFAFATVSFCYKKEQGRINIVDMVSKKHQCSDNSKSTVKALNKKVSFF